MPFSPYPLAPCSHREMNLLYFLSVVYSLGFDLVSVSLTHRAPESLSVRLHLESKQCVL